MASEFLRGAFVQLQPGLTVPVPNVITFQFNPESIRRSLRDHSIKTDAEHSVSPSDPLAASGPPEETFDFTLVLDAKEQILGSNPATAAAAATAQATGIHSRLAALELLMYPVEKSDKLVGKVSLKVPGLGKDPATTVPKRQVPTLLFVWGPGRIVPVRITSYTVSETLYDQRLNPTHAEVQIGLRLLGIDELNAVFEKHRGIAIAAYRTHLAFRQAMAAANLANANDPILGMLPL